MKKFFISFISSLVIFFSFALLRPDFALAATDEPVGAITGIINVLTDEVTGHYLVEGEVSPIIYYNDCRAPGMSMYKYLKNCPENASGEAYSPGILGVQNKIIAMLYDNQISSHEYVADILDNIGIPTISRAYAQSTGGGTGYNAMKPFLDFWKVFRNLAYSLYIIMFVVVGIMIMLRTKVNAQTIITIQTALPNLLITLLLITFSYAIVGFMIDLMYFAIYFIVYLISTTGIIDASKMITRLMSYSAWSVIFAGRNSIISAVTASISGILGNLGTGALGAAGGLINLLPFGSIFYLMVAVAFAIAMIKLMFALIKSYVMLIIQTITAPLQILMNAMPGSKAFSEWLKKTASYLIPFPVAAAMFIFAGILVGNPTSDTILKDLDPRDANPFGVDQNHAIYQNRQDMWLPPFTLTDSAVNTANPEAADILTLIGVFVFLMTPATVKMAQDWLQVKESPYTAEAFSNLAMGGKAGAILPNWGWKSYQEELGAKRSAKALGGVIGNRGKELHDEKTPGAG